MWRSLPTAAADPASARCNPHTQFSTGAARLLSSCRRPAAAAASRRHLSIRADVSGGVVETDPNTVPGINVIPESRWKEGIPPVMGAHLMESGAVRSNSGFLMHVRMVRAVTRGAEPDAAAGIGAAAAWLHDLEDASMGCGGQAHMRVKRPFASSSQPDTHACFIDLLSRQHSARLRRSVHITSCPQIAPISTSKGPGTGEAHQFYYPDTDADVGVIAYGTPAGANAQIAKLVAGEAAKAIQAKGAFTLVLTGVPLYRWMHFRATDLRAANADCKAGWRARLSGTGSRHDAAFGQRVGAVAAAPSPGPASWAATLNKGYTHGPPTVC